LSDASGVGSADFINVRGQLDITSGTVSFTTLDTTTNSVYVIAQYQTLAGSAFGTTIGTPAGYTLDYKYNGLNEIALVAAIPEPSALVLVGVGLFGLFVARRWRGHDARPTAGTT